jgi:sugar phosphate isomerase/epimerase
MLVKIGVITNGISEDLEYALKVMNKTGVKYAELQFVWDKEVGDHAPEEIDKIKKLVDSYGVKVSCVSRHNFNGLSVMDTEVGDENYNLHMAYLKKTIDMAKALGPRLVRVMTLNKQMVIWGTNGADRWVAGGNKSWDKFLKLFEKPVQLAEDEDVDLVMETGTNAMIVSGFLARKMIEDLGTKHLKVIWDIANSLYCADIPFPDAYAEIRNYIGHIHMKDMKVDIPKATVNFRSLGRGDLAPYLEDIANALRKDNYNGVISLESVYRPDGGIFEDGYYKSIEVMKELFG